MKKKILLLILATTGLFSCKQGSKSEEGAGAVEVSNSKEKGKGQKLLSNPVYKFIDTQYKYVDAPGQHLIIENSLPKGGLKYTAPDGKVYVYAVFWTRITNETVNPFTLTIDFPVDSFEFPSSPERYFKILIPSDTMTLEKVSLFNYGLSNLKPFLDSAIHKPSSLKRTINPNESNVFYFVILSYKGVNGTLRTGLNLKGQDLFYRINDKVIPCGKIDLKGFTLQK
jgi:hypothetical protein